MFPKKSGHIVLIAKLIKFTLLPCTRLGNVVPWLKVSEHTIERKEDMADKNIPFNESSPKLQRNRLSG